MECPFTFYIPCAVITNISDLIMLPSPEHYHHHQCKQNLTELTRPKRILLRGGHLVVLQCEIMPGAHNISHKVLQGFL